MLGITMLKKKTVLLVTDLYYEAKGREYFREDIELSAFLRKFFNVCISHIDDLEKVVDQVDALLLRNTGPQALHREALDTLRKRHDLALFNDLSGKGDINGKGHLLELFKAGFPVIPTFSSKEGLEYERYLLKPIDGADSHGVKIVSDKELLEESCNNVLIQPLVEFQYEVSFYFVGKQFYYALYAPDPHKRWALELYTASKEDREFAYQFINWNSCKHGIQRVDACRTENGELLLMELEDYNPFLSLNLLNNSIKNDFLEAVCLSLSEVML